MLIQKQLQSSVVYFYEITKMRSFVFVRKKNLVPKEMLLPFCIVDYILKIGGAYSLNKTERPYITELHLVKDVLPEHGVRVSILHLKELKALEHAYHDYMNSPIGIYPDAWHIT